MTNRADILLEFTYTNWKDEEHIYLFRPELSNLKTMAYGDGEFHYYITGHVLQRDGVHRPGRRSFILAGMSNMKEIPAS